MRKQANSIRFRFEKHWNSTEMRQVLRRKREQEDVLCSLRLVEAMEVRWNCIPMDLNFHSAFRRHWHTISFTPQQVVRRIQTEGLE
jgi:hypothetical protein